VNTEIRFDKLSTHVNKQGDCLWVDGLLTRKDLTIEVSRYADGDLRYEVTAPDGYRFIRHVSDPGVQQGSEDIAKAIDELIRMADAALSVREAA
jgi:hypothetical protein